jgi:hypothetical protein
VTILVTRNLNSTNTLSLEGEEDSHSVGFISLQLLCSIPETEIIVLLHHLKTNLLLHIVSVVIMMLVGHLLCFK